MKSIFESLENLEVSESCFNEILDKIEEELYDVVSRAEKKGIVNPQKANILKDKAIKATTKEKLDSQNRDFAGLNKYEARERMDAKRSQVKNKTFDNLNTPESLCKEIIDEIENTLLENMPSGAFANAYKKTLDIVAKPGEVVKNAANKIADKASDAVTNMKGSLGDKIRKTKVARTLFGNRALRNAQKGINRAKGDWNAVVKDDMAANSSQPEHHYADGIKKATQKAIDTEKKWGARIHY